MFEINGVKGVLSHRSSRDIAAGLMDVLEYKGYAQRVPELQAAFEHNDMLALSFARLLIYTLPFKLPTTSQEGWEQYLSAWRPGKPRADTWKGYWIVASAAVGTKA